MKIVHTSDLHLGAKLYGWDRTDEEEHFFSQLKQIISEEQPDALLIAGDIFDNGTPGNDIAKKFTDSLLEVTTACKTMETVVIAGNHDSYSRLIVDKSLWEHCNVHIFGIPAEDENGTASFENNIVIIPGKGVIAAVPFCHERNFPLVSRTVTTTDSRIRSYFGGLAEYVNGMANGLPRILMAHLTVGKDSDFTGQNGLRDNVIGGLEGVDADVLGTGYDYIALGHIHCPQWIKGSKVARYCGTPRAKSFDESYQHGVDVVCVEAGKEPVLKTRYLEPLRTVKTVGGKEGIAFEKALEEIANLDAPNESYIRLNVVLKEGEKSGVDWVESAREACAVRGFRYCLINPIYNEQEKKECGAKVDLTVDELKDLTNDKVVEIVSLRCNFGERQKQLLKDFLNENNF